MRRMVLALCALLSFVVSAATPTITDVAAQQRYPWNGKVDISYTVTGDIAEEAKQKALLTSLKVTAQDKVADKTYTATQLSGDMALTAGTHKFVWDMNAEGLTFKSDDVVFNVSCETTPATYCVIDLSAGAEASSYPVTYLAEPPDGGFNVDEYKTSKLVLRRIEPGSIPIYDAALTKTYFIGIFEVTQRQYELVMGMNPSSRYGQGDNYPVYYVSYDMIRGSSNGTGWPRSSAVDETSFMGKFRTNTGGLEFDLPTEAQWVYACCAGASTTYSYGDSADGNYMWYRVNSGTSSHVVGSKLPNAWGLYDMHGNVREWCLDWYGGTLTGNDPVGPSSSGYGYRVLRGGGFSDSEGYCTSSYQAGTAPSEVHLSDYGVRGFRLCLTL